jgi:DNA-binding IclR family transcriptional regulator
MIREDQEHQYLSTVKNALRILNYFSVEQPELRVSDLAAGLGLNKSAVSRLLATLASEGYVIKDPETQKYRLGLRILTLNSIVTSQLEINREARPILRQLVQEVGEAAHIAVLEGSEVVYVEQVESQHHVRILSYVGRRNPVHCTSSGKVMLAFQSPDFLENFLRQKLERYTSATVTDPDVLRRQLTEIRSTDFCSSIGEFLDDVVSFASPVRDYTKKVIAAVSVIGPKHRIKPQQYPFIKNKVIKAAREISRNLGYYHT